MIGSAPFMGMLFSLFLFHYAALTNLKKSICGSLPMVLSGSFLILAASTNSLWSYTLCIVLGFMLLTAIIPFLTSIYSDNYPVNRRGAFYSKAVLVTVLVSIVSGYIGSSLAVPAIAGVWALLERERLGWRPVSALFAATLAAGALVVLALYGRFLPVLFREVLPHAAGGTQEASGPWAAAQRLYLFFGPAGLLLVALGVVALRGAPPGPRRAHLALLLAGTGLLAMRYLLPALFRDVKEVELLTPAVAIAAAAALRWLARRGRAGPALAIAGAAALAGWGAARAVEVYGSRFLAVGL